MNAKYSFRMESQERRRALPGRIIIGQKNTETTAHVVLKFLAFVLFHRERIQIETSLPDDHIPFTPDIAQLDYELQPTLWVECGECSIRKLDKLAVKAPKAELWAIKRSPEAAHHLHAAMTKAGLRQNRYGIVGLDTDMFEEMVGLLGSRNDLLWVSGTFDPPHLQFDFNGLWFDAPFTLLRF